VRTKQILNKTRSAQGFAGFLFFSVTKPDSLFY
jgi:hypothetical protein